MKIVTRNDSDMTEQWQKKSETQCLAALFFAMLCQTAFTAFVNLTRYYGYKASLFDLGVFDQIIWRMGQGLAPLTDIVPPYATQHWFGFHFSPILAVLAPYTWIWHGPEPLIWAQSVLLALPALVVFRIARRLNHSPRAALGWAMLYLVNHYVVAAAIMDFHEIAFAVPLMALGMLMVIEKRFMLLVICCAGLVLTKEHYGLAAAGFGLLWWAYNKDMRRGMGLACAGVFVQFLVLMVLMPAYGDVQAHPMFSDHYVIDRYHWMTLPWGEKLRMLNTLLFSLEKGQMPIVLYAVFLLMTVLFLPLLAPLLLLPLLPDLLANMLSRNVMTRFHFSYHSAAMIPVLLAAAMVGWHKIRAASKPAWTLVLCIFCGNVFLYGLYDGIRYWEALPLQLREDGENLNAVRALVAPDEKLAAQANIGTFFARRSHITSFPVRLNEADALVLHLHYPYASPARVVLSTPFMPLVYEQYMDEVRKVMRDENWQVRYWKDNWLVLKRPGAGVAEPEGGRREVEERLRAMERVF